MQVKLDMESPNNMNSYVLHVFFYNCNLFGAKNFICSKGTWEEPTTLPYLGKS